MTRRRLLIGALVVVLAIPIAIFATGESGTYTMTVGGDVSAGVLQTTSCTIVDAISNG